MMSRSRSRNRLILSTALAGGLLLSTPVAAQTSNGTLPNASDASVILGTATITGGGPTPGSTLDVSLVTGTTVIDWFHFDVPAGDTARFTNNAAVPVAAVLNRVRAGGPVAIAAPSNLSGTITAPGVELWIQNGEGFLFGSNLSITSAGFLASVPDISLADFTAGGGFRATTSAGSTAGIRGGGAGTRILTNGGKLALIAPVIDVNGTFDAGTGQVAFVTATDVSMTMAPGSPLAITVNRGTSVGGASQIVAGSVAGNEAYFVLASAGSVVDSLLDVRAATRASGAVATGRGVVLVAGDVSTAPGVSFAGGSATNGAAGIALSGTVDATGTGQQVALRASRDIAATTALTASGGISAEAGGALALTRATAGTGIVIKAGGAVTATGLLDSATGAVEITGAALSLDDVTARAGSVKLTGAAVRADDIVAGTTVQAAATTGAIALGSIAAGGNVTLAGAPAQAIGVTRATSSTGGGLTIDGSGAVRLGSADIRDAITIGATTAPASIEATGALRGNGIDLRSAGDVTLVDAASATVITLASGGALRAGNLTATAGGITGTATTIDIAGAASRDAALSLTATGASLRLGNSSVQTGATVTAAAGDIAIGSLTSATGDLKVSGRSLAGTTTPGATLAATGGAIDVATTGAAALASATAGAGLIVASGATLRIDDTARAIGAVTLTAPGAITLGTVVSAGGPVTVTGGAAISGTGAAGGDISAAGALAVTAAGAITLDALAGDVLTVAGPSLSVGSATARAGDAMLTASAGDATLGDGSAARDLIVTASGAAAVRGTVEAGRDYRVRGASVRLGEGTGSETQRAARFATITATTGGITGGGGLTLIGDGAGAGIGTAVTLDAANGAISLPGSVLRGGTARQSDVALRFAAGTPLVLGDVVANAFGRTDAGGGAVVPIAHDAAITLGNLDLAGSLSLSTSAGGLTTGTIASTGSVTLIADTIVTGDVTAATTIAATATGALAGQRLRSVGGTTVSGGRVQLVEASATAGAVDVRATGGRLDIGTANGTNVGLATSGGGGSATLAAGTVTASGTATLNSVGGIDLGTVTAGGAIAVTAAGPVGRIGGAGNITSTGGNVTVTAGGAAALGNVAGESVLIRAAAIDTVSNTARTGTVTLDATADALNAGRVTSFGDLRLTAAGALTANDVTSSAGNVAIASGDAVLVGAIAGNAIDVRGARIETGSVTARSGPLAMAASSGTLRVGEAVATGDVTLAAAGAMNTTNITSSAGSVAITAGGAARMANVTGNAVTATALAIDAGDVVARAGNVELTTTAPASGNPSNGQLTVSNVTASGAATLYSNSRVVAGSVSAGIGDLLLRGYGVSVDRLATQNGNATILSHLREATLTGSATIGGRLSIDGATVLLGIDADAETISARDSISITAIGAVNGGPGLTLLSNSAGSSANGDIFINGGFGILFAPDTVIRAGPDRQSSVGLRVSASNAAITLGSVFADRIGNAVSSSGQIIGQLTAPSITVAGPIVTRQSFTATATGPGGRLELADVTATNAGAEISLGSSSGGITARSVSSPGAISIASGGELAVASVASSGSNVSVNVSGGANATIGAASAGGTLSLSSGPGNLSLGTGVGRDVRIVSARSLAADSLTSVGGEIFINAGTATIGTATATTALTVTGSSGGLTFGTASAGTTATLSAQGPVTVSNSLVATGAIGVTATGSSANIGTVRSTSGQVAIDAASVTATTASAGTSLAVNARSGAIALGTGTAGTTARLTATGDVGVSTGLTSGGSATVNGANLRLANVDATNGAVTATATGDVTGATAADRVNLTAGGAGNSLAVTAGGVVRLGQATAANAVTVRGAAIDATTATATSGALDLNATAGALTLGTGAAGGAATLRSTGAMTVGALTSRGATLQSGSTLNATTITSTADIAVTATGAATLGTLTATGAGNSLAVTSGGVVRLGQATAGNAVTVRGTAIDATTATATSGALDLNATAGALTLGTGAAGGIATLRSTGAMTVGALTSRGATLQSGSTLNATTITSTADIAVTATDVATLGTLTATGAIAATGNGVTATRLGAGTTLGVTSGGAVSIGSATAGGAATIDAAGAATLGAITAGPSLSVRAADATITGAQRATAVTFANRAPATTALRLGDTTAADGFRLSQAEIGLIDADRLTLDGGSGAVEIGALGFGATAGRTSVDVLTTGRIDVRGAVTGAGSGRLFRFGGTAANLTDRASDIRIATTANGGGRLLFSTADLELRGARVAQGQSAGFLDALTGLSPADVAGRFVSNAGSSLYAANQGGVAYDAAAATILSANRVTVRFTDYALFQNTGLLGENSGAVIGASSGPALNFIANGDAGGAGALAIFGTVGGVGGIATALLGPSAIGATSVDLRAARVNGCLLGSGAGCLSNVVSQPILSIFDASRTQILRASDNLSVPFDPVVGTNNEALFSGVSSIDAPLEDIAPPTCPEGSTDPACPRKENNQ
ncbi:hypothetical protein [Sphingomonas sp.]|uniref:hypothetical protein n=1 Tax=Sphingomonas sp. TaxID=28214 RepID=UPI002DD661B0|nr:hypothetical protein [Sphingomonas sp.]